MVSRNTVGDSIALYSFCMRKLALIALTFLLLVAGIWFTAPQLLGRLAPHIVEESESQQFNDMLIDMQQDVAIQAGFIQTMHEQTWSNVAFFSFLGIDIPLGKSEATVRAPIKVYYGVRPYAVHAIGKQGNQLHLTVDRVEVLAVDADISKLEIRTENGWARFDATSGEEARARAKKAFEVSKYRAADNMLKSMQVTADVRAALKAIAVQITGITDVRIDRLDLIKAE